MTPIEIASRRLRREEGVRKRAYNDATGKTVSCKPFGNLTIGVGINLENGLDDEEVDWLLHHRLEKIETVIRSLDFYRIADPVRASVMLDVGFNVGVIGLLEFRQMIAAMERQDFERAAIELLDSDAARQLPERYHSLAQVLRTGVDAYE